MLLYYTIGAQRGRHLAFLVKFGQVRKWQLSAISSSISIPQGYSSFYLSTCTYH